MKAIVKATGEIVEVEKEGPFYNVIDGYERYYEHELDFQDVISYWEKLKHQYAGMAMQGIISNEDYLQSFFEDGRCSLFEDVARSAEGIAIALVERLQEKEEK